VRPFSTDLGSDEPPARRAPVELRDWPLRGTQGTPPVRSHGRVDEAGAELEPSMPLWPTVRVELLAPDEARRAPRGRPEMKDEQIAAWVSALVATSAAFGFWLATLI